MGLPAVIVLACNEDNVLGRCLESCAGMELHVSIDVKTTDESRAVAERYGAKLYEHEFTNNSWADTRNAVMERVEANSEAAWFAWLDADEWWHSGRELIPQALEVAEEGEAGGVAVLLRDNATAPSVISGQWLNVKLLRRGVRYERRRHEVVPADLKRVQAEQIVIGHEKRQRPEVIEANERLKQDLEALQADYAEYGDRRSAYYVADTYQKTGRFWDAIAWYKLGLGLPANQAGLDQLLREGLAQTYRRMGQHALARQTSLELLAQGREGFGEACFDLASDSHNLRHFNDAGFYAQMAIAAGSHTRSAGIGHPDKCGALAYYVLAMVEFNKDNLLGAASYLGRAKELGQSEKFAQLERMIFAEGAKQQAEEVSGDAVVCGGGPDGTDG